MILIVGAGITGCVLAELIARKAKEKVLVIDKRSHIAGNLFDEKIDNIWAHRYGPHIFHTNNEQIWQYINNFATFHPYIHKVRAIIDGIEIPLPFNLISMQKLFPKSLCDTYIQKLSENFTYGARISILDLKQIKELQPLAHFIYDKVFKNYSHKQWGGGISLESLDPEVARRVPFVFGKTDCYFDDKFQGIPQEGYTQLCQKMLEHPGIQVSLNTDYKNIDTKQFSKIFYCGGIDEFFDFQFGHLQYRGIKFKFQTIDTERFQNNSVVNYPNNYDFTRITEYKHFLPTRSLKTFISMEYPMAYINQNSEQCYPIPNQEQKELYQKYLQHAQNYPNIYFCGRLGKYQYLDMDDAIQNALSLFEKVFRE